MAISNSCSNSWNGSDLLRLLTCGSVDDGKSTLIGRLLLDSGTIYDDDLKRIGDTSGQLDLALLTDALEDERTQGITIDVAYRYFSTPNRSFVIADTPGHVQYTRNMVTGASSADLAVVLIDASKGVTSQTRRHMAITSALGIGSIVAAVNKMDLVDWSKETFDAISTQVFEIAQVLQVADVVTMPMSALQGSGVVNHDGLPNWYAGTCLLEHLEQVQPARASVPEWLGAQADKSGHQSDFAEDDFSGDDFAGDDFAEDDCALRAPVQLVVRADGFRGYATTVAGGVLRAGDAVRIEPSGLETVVAEIVTFDGALDEVRTGDSVVVTVTDDIDIGRGHIFTSLESPMLRGLELEAVLVWMSETDLKVGHEYLLAQGPQRLRCWVTGVSSCVDVDSLELSSTTSVVLNDIAVVQIQTEAELPFDLYYNNRHTGSFILIDPADNSTAAGGMVMGQPESRWDVTPATTLEQQRSEVTLDERLERFGQQPVTVLFTGLTCAGKSTLATALERDLFDRGHATVRLDGENLRRGISRDLGFTAADRSENVRRTAELARLINNQGMIAIVALVAPDASVRDRARTLIGAEQFVEVFLDPPLEVCQKRDESGMYAAAERGEIPMFPGVSAPYDKPTAADLVLDTSQSSVAECQKRVLELLVSRGFIGK